MKSHLLLASIAALAALGGASSLAHADETRRDSGARLQAADRPSEGVQGSASDRSDGRAARRDDRHDRAYTARMRHDGGVDRGMQVVPTTAGPGEPGDGWRYFSNSAAGRAVVISPQGEYFLSRGRGLRLVAVTQPSS